VSKKTLNLETELSALKLKVAELEFKLKLAEKELEALKANKHVYSSPPVIIPIHPEHERILFPGDIVWYEEVHVSC
jgi:hypothetical protein